MKIFLLSILSILLSVSLVGQDVLFSFENDEIIFDGTDSIYTVDVMISSQTLGGAFKMSSGQLYINYSNDAFGPNVYQSGNVFVFTDSPKYLLNSKDSQFGVVKVYSPLQLNDNTNDRLSLAWQQDRAGACISESVYSIPRKLFRIGFTYKTNGSGADPMVCFESQTLYSNQTYTECGSFADCSTLPIADCLMFPGAQVVDDSFSCQISYTLGLEAKAMLEGPYNNVTGQMNTDLQSVPDFPLMEPYTALGWHTDGGEVVLSRVMTNNDVVDWVLIELRDKNDVSVVLETAVGLLLADGTIIDERGNACVNLAIVKDSYYVAIRHRNHLGAVTATPISLGYETNTIDFTTVALMGTNATNNANTDQLLWMGDTNSDGTVDASDRSNTWNERNTNNTYILSDCNLDGNVDAADRSITWNRRNQSQQLP